MHVMRAYIRRAAAAAATLALVACANDPVSTDGPQSAGNALVVGHFEISATQGVSGQPSDSARQRAVITDAATWTRFWASLKPDPNAGGTPPTVDFSRDMVIAVSMPVRPSSGYDIQITSVTEFADHLDVEVVERSPSSDCVLLPVITRPFDIVQLPRRDKPVRFVERAEVVACTPAARGDTVSVAFGKSVDVHGVRVTLLHVPNDSRCPINAYCIWEGDAAVTLRFERGGQTTEVTLHTSAKSGLVSTTVAGTEFRLVRLDPFLVIGQPRPPESDYSAVLLAR
jgi:hypothetical protein